MAKAFYIPNGPKNLATLFPAINFRNLSEYYLQIKSGTDVICTTTMNKVQSCSDNDDELRIHFLSGCGTIDAINFKRLVIEHDPKSDNKESAVKYPLVKSDHAIGRFNVKANDIITVCNTQYGEDDRQWLSELLDSPLAWIEWKGTQGQADSYIPIVISDTKMQLIKEDDRFYYELKLQFTLSHAKSILR